MLHTKIVRVDGVWSMFARRTSTTGAERNDELNVAVTNSDSPLGCSPTSQGPDLARRLDLEAWRKRSVCRAARALVRLRRGVLTA